MQHVVKTAGLSAGELVFGFVERFQLSGQWLLGWACEDDPALFAADLKLVAVVHV